MNGINEMYTDAPQETTENNIPAEDSDQGVDEVSGRRCPLTPTYRIIRKIWYASRSSHR